ncbi:hypothetical protein [Algoriphagus sp. A40]|uniref:hypothetical protein n=1 Tax=Algoriphagus sp. A40 TaxID=1945863 RepID=UPI00098525FE|nr:hypothetical protein [Algoriphagus sp. A40]OOG70527.1 hypothetical protein B0E43_18175 [Algoriphagus sp. A40]
MEKQKDLTWLEHLQRNSWEPEVIISGISLAFLFVIPSRLFEFSVILIQDYGLEQIPAQLILVYFSVIISVFKIFLVSHLVMRFIWAGMLGITYAFPDGIVKEKLFKYSQSVEYHPPQYFLLKLERWCSMLYGAPISVAIPIFSITVYLLVLIGIYLVFNLDFQIVYIIFMISMAGFAIVPLLKKNSGIKDFVGKSMSGTIGAIYQSNLGKWFFVSFSISLVVLAMPFIVQDTKGFSAYQASANVDDSYYEWPDDGGYFEEYNSEKRRFARMWTPAKTVSGEVLNLYLARYEREESSTQKMNGLLSTDTIEWKKIESLVDQYRIYLNDSLIDAERWVQVTAGHTGQMALFGQIPIAHLPTGIHEVRLEKLTYLPPFLGTGHALRHRKKWARFEFIKE